MANANKTPKAAANKADQNKETKKVSVLDAIAAKLPMAAKTSTSSIYRAELFDGQDDKGKKAIRCKVRRIRNQFVGAFLEASGKKDILKGLQKDWGEFASQVYNNASLIFEKNTSEEDQKIFQDFVKAMAADYTK